MEEDIPLSIKKLSLEICEYPGSIRFFFFFIPWARGEIPEYVMASDERQFVLNHSDAFSFLSEAGQNRNNLINAAENALNEITSVLTAL